MKVKIKVEKEFDLKLLVVKAKPRYWEDARVNGVEDTEGSLIPCRDGDLWSPHIDIDSGVIVNWNKGTTAEIHYKACDLCGYEILDAEGNVVLSAEDGYVPDTLCPERNGWGDYISMNIDSDGKIQGWKFDIEDFLIE